MIDDRERRRLGMDRAITRRDFLGGVAVSTAAVWTAGGAMPLWAQDLPFAPESDPDYYPPALTGLRGSHVGSFEAGHALRDGTYADFPSLDVDTGETYDLVVVGGGLSGLSAAYFFQKNLGADRRVLILDNHDDFGGHAKRNEFTHDGRTYIGYGGTQGISTPFPFSHAAKSLIAELGIEIERYPEFVDTSMLAGLGRAVFFDRETFGADRLVVGEGDLPWEEFFARAPFSPQARADLVRIHTQQKDYLPELTSAETRARLQQISYRDYLLNVAGVSEEAVKFFLGDGARNNKRVDTLPALEAAQSRAPGTVGLSLDLDPRWAGSRDYRFHYPDGNASVARLLVNRMIPKAMARQHTIESILPARPDYPRLDDPGSPVRLRLNSTAVRVRHDGDPWKARSVDIAYVRGGKVHGVRARNCVMACWNGVIPYLMPELPAEQKDALAYPVKVPLMYTNAFIRNWTSFKTLGISRISYPAMYHTSCRLDTGVSIGGYECSQSSDDPIVLHMVRHPNTPGLPRREQHRRGMRDMLTTPFETIEYETRQQLARALAGGGFDPAEDILAITANRWPHGYAYTYDTLADPDVPDADRPHVLGRRPFGKVAIANADAGAAAYTNVAIDEAHRAVQELMLANGLK